MTLDVGGRRISVLDRGEGPPVVLVHASGLSSAQWGPVAPRLAERRRVLAPDLLGCGASDPANPHGVENFISEPETIAARGFTELYQTGKAAWGVDSEIGQCYVSGVIPTCIESSRR